MGFELNERKAAGQKSAGGRGGCREHSLIASRWPWASERRRSCASPVVVRVVFFAWPSQLLCHPPNRMRKTASFAGTDHHCEARLQVSPHALLFRFAQAGRKWPRGIHDAAPGNEWTERLGPVSNPALWLRCRRAGRVGLLQRQAKAESSCLASALQNAARRSKHDGPPLSRRTSRRGQADGGAVVSRC